jgi:hypothetical protein
LGELGHLKIFSGRTEPKEKKKVQIYIEALKNSDIVQNQVCGAGETFIFHKNNL